jgi:hypothetical protein
VTLCHLVLHPFIWLVPNDSILLPGSQILAPAQSHYLLVVNLWPVRQCLRLTVDAAATLHSLSVQIATKLLLHYSRSNVMRNPTLASAPLHAASPAARKASSTGVIATVMRGVGGVMRTL